MMTVDDKKYFNTRLKEVTDEVRSIKSEVLSVIQNAIINIKENIADKLDPIKETLKRYEENHKSHYLAINQASVERKEMSIEITALKLNQNDQKNQIDNITKTVNGLDRRQTKDEGKEKGREIEKQSWVQKNGTIIAIIGTVLGILGFLSRFF